MVLLGVPCMHLLAAYPIMIDDGWLIPVARSVPSVGAQCSHCLRAGASLGGLLGTLARSRRQPDRCASHPECDARDRRYYLRGSVLCCALPSAHSEAADCRDRVASLTMFDPTASSLAPARAVII